MTARMPWMAARQPFQTVPTAQPGAILGDRLGGILRAGGRKAALLTEEGAQGQLVSLDQRE